MLCGLQESQRKFQKYIEVSENENTKYQIMQDADKAVLRWKCISSNAYMRKEERIHQINLNSNLKKLETKEQNTPKT